MWFKNLSVFTLDAPWELPPAALESLLVARVLQPCPPSTPEVTGWVPPGTDGVLVPSLERHLLVALGWESRLLPSAVVNEAAAERAAAFEAQRGFKPGRKLMRDIKEQVAAELLPRAFTRRTQLAAWIDPPAGRICVDTATLPKAETLLQQLRDALGSLPAIPWSTEVAPSSVMTQWLLQGRAPGDFALDAGCELSGSDETRSVVRYVRLAPEDAVLRKHVEEGLRATQVALTWRGQVGFTLTEGLQLRRLRYLEADAEDGDRVADPQLAFEADFALMTGTLRALLDDLAAALAAA